jgi:hypothetical protein
MYADLHPPLRADEVSVLGGGGGYTHGIHDNLMV